MKKNKKKILIIEDEISLREALRINLQKEDFDVFTAENGEKGLVLVTKEKPDLVILDLVLPGMPGEEVLKKMSEKKTNKNIPVLILTVKSEEANVNNCLKLLGAVDYLIKANYTLKQIVDKIKKLV